MPSNRFKVRMIATLALVLLVFSGSAPTTEAGPIADMLARYRQNKQMKLPPMDKPFSNKPVRDLNARNTSLTQRFKQRFHLNRRSSESPSLDPGLMKTSR